MTVITLQMKKLRMRRHETSLLFQGSELVEGVWIEPVTPEPELFPEA